MIIQHNLAAMNGNRMYGITSRAKAKSSEKLSSGYRINRSADDAAGLAISEKMRRQIRGLTQASFNSQDGISMVQTAEGALNEVHDMLQRMNELCVKAATGTLTEDDRGYIQEEIYAITDEIDRIGATTRFNDIKLFDGLPQTKTTPVMPSGTINGGKGVITPATDDKDAYYTIDNVRSGDIAFIPSYGIKPDTYYMASTAGEIADYTRQRQEYLADLAEYERQKAIYDQDPSAPGAVEPVMPTEVPERDGSSADKPKMVDMQEFHREIAMDLLRENLRANSDLADSASVTYVIGAAKTDFYIHLYGPLPVSIQVGADEGQTYDFTINPVNASRLGVLDINVKDNDGSGAKAGIAKVKSAIDKTNSERAYLGAVQNRLEHIVKNLDNVVENTTAAESRIRDTDMASEMQKYSNLSVLQQAGQTILAQANQSKQGVLSLLQ